MPNIGKSYTNEIIQIKRTKTKYGLSNADIVARCEAYCREHPELTTPSPSTISKIFAPNSENDTFSYKTIQPVIAVLSDMDRDDVEFQLKDSGLYFEQVQTLTLAVEQKNIQIEELERQRDFFKSQYERLLVIVEALSKK